MNGARERVLKRINEIMAKEVTRSSREPHNEKLSDFCSSSPPPPNCGGGVEALARILDKKKYTQRCSGKTLRKETAFNIQA